MTAATCARCGAMYELRPSSVGGDFGWCEGCVAAVRRPGGAGPDVEAAIGESYASADDRAHDDDGQQPGGDDGRPLRPGERQGRIVLARDVRRERVEWEVPGLVPRRAVTLVVGEPGLGKSTWTAQLVAEATKAGRFCLVVSVEDSRGAVERPRLEAAGADLALVGFLDLEDEHGRDGLRLPDDIATLTRAVRDRQARIVVIDPLMAHLGGKVDSHKDQGIRSALAPLARLAEDCDLAVVAVSHFNKGEASSALSRVGGSVGLTGAARSVLVMARDPDDPDGDTGARRVLIPIKGNWSRLAAGRLLAIEPVVLPAVDGHDEVETTRLRDLGAASATAADAIGGNGADGTPTDREAAAHWLADHLADGEWHPRVAVVAAAKKADVSERTLKRASQEVAEIRNLPGSWPRRTEWRLHSQTTPVAPPVGPTPRPHSESRMDSGNPTAQPDSRDTRGEWPDSGSVDPRDAAVGDWRADTIRGVDEAAA